MNGRSRGITQGLGDKTVVLVLLKFSSVWFFASVGRTLNQTLGPVRGTWLNPKLDLSLGFTMVQFWFRGVVNPELDVKSRFLLM